MLVICWSGDVAQVGERYVRNVQVRGSSPLISTIFCENVSLTNNHLSGDDMKRDANIDRKTKETEISLKLNLDGSGLYHVDTGDPFHGSHVEPCGCSWVF